MQRVHINVEIVAEDEGLDSQNPRPAETRPLWHNANILQLGELPGQVEEGQLREDALLAVEGGDLLHGISLKQVSDVLVSDGLVVAFIQTVAQHFQVRTPGQKGLLVMKF